MDAHSRKILRNFLIELVVYALLVVAYFYVVLRLLSEPLTELYQADLIRYAVIALALMLIQAVALEYVTSFLLRILGLEQLE
jgi:hypothetical protein